MLRKWLILCSLALAFVGFFGAPKASAHPDSPVPHADVVPAPPLTVTYTVVAGDTLSSIAPNLGLTWQQIASYNSMTWAQAQAIDPGQVLNIPPASYTPTASYVHPEAQRSASETVTLVTYASKASTTSSSSFGACVAWRESRDTPTARNGAYWGEYQMSSSVWSAGGGSASDYGSASAAEQTAVFNQAVVKLGTSPWRPYDHC